MNALKTQLNGSKQLSKSKENNMPNEKKSEIVGTSAPSVGSAIDLINNSTQKTAQPKAKTPVKISTVPIIQSNENHKRALSTNKQVLLI